MVRQLLLYYLDKNCRPQPAAVVGNQTGCISNEEDKCVSLNWSLYWIRSSFCRNNSKAKTGVSSYKSPQPIIKGRSLFQFWSLCYDYDKD